MTNNSTDAQIKSAYENAGMIPSEIAKDLGFDEVAVKAKLMQVSSKYRQDMKSAGEDTSDTLNFSDDQLADVNKVIFETALSAQYPDGTVDYKTRLTAACYVRDDKKGRKEVQKHVANTQNNMFVLNELFQAARMGASKMREQITSGSNKPINV